jgi:hypothetical protein
MQEFQALTAETDADASEEEHIKALFAEVDTNKDGKVHVPAIVACFLRSIRCPPPPVFAICSHTTHRSALMNTWVKTTLPQLVLQMPNRPLNSDLELID